MRIVRLWSVLTLALFGWGALVPAPSVPAQEANPKFPPLPHAVSSLGAIVSDGYLYVYGGHAGKTHTYSTKDVLGTFHRLKLDGGTQWEELPGGPILQGMNLAAHRGKIYRVGGMRPRNEPGQPSDNVSVVEAARYDPKAGQWEPLPPLPAGRSSHDVVVVGDQLVVVGGWQSRGRGVPPRWHDTAVVLDLSAKQLEWREIPQPFQRRALTAAVVGEKVYVLCGLDAKGDLNNRVDVLDVPTGKWSQGPDVPGERVGFSPAATTVDNSLVISTSDGKVYRLSQDGQAWELLAEGTSKRIVHRLVPYRGDVLLVGGAIPGGGGNVTALERVALPRKGVSDAGQSSRPGNDR
jgi:N-acetylneuraminic acid mutarotase